MGMEKFRSKFFIFISILFFASCVPNEEKVLSEAYAQFNYQVNDLKLDSNEFNGPVKLIKDSRGTYPRKNHILYGWNRVVKMKTIWIYVEVDTTFTKEPSVSYSDNFFETLK
ncbi:hypothetical protein HNP37_002116 [Flavobacterium nitrogenifigens]|uniref:Lipoprotein n=2 Tax=Flavobacterium TaxID=237 RepID=A0A7W7N6Q6_9FLAO|nr:MULTISPECIES: hypothetical protein [Flavobacterium]MBB4802055.1 hypothetical protein [Flavobacterium nitrogenifigens]MBB6387013.1 hypothetical protein [Flavobacterium notoginsengisoli]